MRLTDEEQAMLAGEHGPARQWAIRHQVAVGEFFDAPDFVRVGQAHIMADTESLGQSGVAWLEELAVLPREQRRVRIPTITDPRGLDFDTYKRLKQTRGHGRHRGARHRRLRGARRADDQHLHQLPDHPAAGARRAPGDGRHRRRHLLQQRAGRAQQLRGRPLGAGRRPHRPHAALRLSSGRAPRRHHALRACSISPRDLADWGALGGIVGKATNSYWEVPVISGRRAKRPIPTSSKHFGAALASFGSVALFHMPGVTPEAPTLAEAFAGRPMPPATRIERADFDAFYAGYAAAGDKVDVVVFAAPQLSLVEMQQVAELLDGRRVHADTSLIVTTSPEIKFAADRMGLTRRIEDAGGIVAAGVCFYQSYAREMAEANGWQRLLTNSAKLVNIIAGYGYKPALASMERCIDSAVAGRIV